MRSVIGAALTLLLAVPLSARQAEPPPETPPANPPTNPAPKQQPATPPKDDFAKRLDSIDARGKEIKTLRAKFVQKKHTPLLKKPMESSGKLVIKGDKTRWETLEPRKSVMTIDDKGLRIFYPEQRVIEVYDLGADVREFSGSPLPRIDRLREAFTISEAKPSELGAHDDDSKLLAMELRPLKDDLKKRITRVRVLIDATLPSVKRVEIEDADAELTEIEFKDVETNKEIKDADLAMDAPAGTREVHPLGKPDQKPKEAGK